MGSKSVGGYSRGGKGGAGRSTPGRGLEQAAGTSDCGKLGLKAIVTDYAKRNERACANCDGDGVFTVPTKVGITHSDESSKVKRRLPNFHWVLVL